MQRVVREGKDHRRRVVGLRFADGEVFDQVLQVRSCQGC
jgi:hypothetical protein